MSSSRLVGVGVGPGDPDLVTIKAARVLAEADVVLVPATESRAARDGREARPGRAEEIVTAVAPSARIVRIPFSMADASGVTARRREAWDASAQAASDAFNAGARVVAFATIGDPSVYSTFSYLAAAVLGVHPDVEVEVIPGVTAMQALAAASRSPLVEGDEVLALVPLKKGTDRLAEVAQVVDTVAVYKPGRHCAALKEYATATDSDAVVGVNVGTAEEQILPLSEVEALPYFAAVLFPADRGRIGGRL
ncbi:MAG: precorrin-2 C(20)-methyltransferase [Propioniciclava sp.]|uniref:precorrin-2 C(20)-methyltransferase n=1 Tax=Propioniciclava sp. TaxID=2038686 RepID=UPI0039E2450E